MGRFQGLPCRVFREQEKQGFDLELDAADQDLETSRDSLLDVCCTVLIYRCPFTPTLQLGRPDIHDVPGSRFLLGFCHFGIKGVVGSEST